MSTPPTITEQQVNATPPYETITGVVERLTFHSEESGYTVARLVRPRSKDLTTIVGSFCGIIALGVKRTNKKRSRSSGRLLPRNPGSINPKSCINVGVNQKFQKSFQTRSGSPCMLVDVSKRGDLNI